MADIKQLSDGTLSLDAECADEPAVKTQAGEYNL